MWFFHKFVIFSLIVIANTSLPSNVKKCQVGDEKCIGKAIEKVLHEYPHGVTELGLPNLEPYRLAQLILSESNGRSALSLDLKFQDTDIYGISNTIIDHVIGFTSDPNKSKFEIYGSIPLFEMKGKYTANGRILILPIQGNGDAFITLNNCKVSIKFKPIIREENNKIHIGIKHIKVLLEPASMKVRLENLFNGDKALGENMNLFLNENWRDVWNELAVNINQAMADVLRTLMTQVFEKLTYDEFYE